MTPGGPPPDGIPPIDQPSSLPAGSVDFLEDDEPVLALTVGELTGAVGATGVFSRVVDGEELGFEADGDGFVDDRTGSSWNVLGEATAGPMAGTRLEAVPHVDTFWFAWAAFRPDTDVIG